MKKLFIKLVLFSIPFVIYLSIASIVDPFSYFTSNDIVKIELKDKISNSVSPHLYKMIAFENIPTTNIILGDSRSNRLYETISTHSNKWSSLSYGGASLSEVLDTFEWLVIKNFKIDTLLVGINFNQYNMYNKRMWVEETIERKSNPFSYLFSSYTARSTFLILKDLITNESDTIGKPKVSRAKFWDATVKNYGTKYYAQYAYPENSLQRISAMALYCKQKNIELIFWIPPCAKEINDILDEYDLTAENEQFINDIKSLGKLYNFNSIESITSQRNNFTDPSHFNKEIGEKIYQQIFKNK